MTNNIKNVLRRMKICTLLFSVSILFYLSVLPAQNASADERLQKPVVYFFELNEDIMPAAERRVTRALREAKEKNADYVIMRVNTYGGMVNVADSIRTMLLNADAITIAWIKNNAASAGALISIACDSIYMSRGSNIGAATVVNQTGEPMPDKYQSYMRSMMRSTAIAKDRDPMIAEAMVDERVVIEGIIEDGKILTFTDAEAVAAGFVEGKADELEDVLRNLNIEDHLMYRYETVFTERIINFLLHPVVNSILMLIIIGGIYFELQTPGVGFPLMAAIIAASLYFGPLYIEGLATHWELTFFIVGVILIGIEIFVIPGFGIAGILGIVLALTGLTVALIPNEGFDFNFAGGDAIAMAFFRVIVTVLVAFGIILIFGRNLLDSRMFQRMVLADVQDKNKGFTSSDFTHRDLIGMEGIAVTDFRPAGKVEINDELYFAVSDAEWIKRTHRIKVTGIRGSNLVVKSIEPKED